MPGLFDVDEADEGLEMVDAAEADDGMDALAADMLSAVESKDAALLATLLRSIKGT
jgi:hypothetical protein